ncbi:glycosyltransferase family 8 protein [Mycena albidolilacea]|uniref:Glycosyltransferase family 8 protein n=1 Tax=Mycena albidolilacea TaxID=1033008 RepID=A0AAD6Z5C2_9AGAR|nr:glycosyltransferase family 8 protein [Mycena albidolilacea]
MSSFLKRLSPRWTYERLPAPHHDRMAPRTKCTPSTQQWTCLGVVLAATVVLWLATARLRRPPYSPLDNYQNINPLPVTVGAGFDHSPSSRRAVVSSLYSDNFAIAVAVVGYSAKSANVSARLLLPYLEHKVSEKALCIARAVGWEPYPVPLIHPPHNSKGIHPRFMDQYTKLNIWNLDRMGVDSAVYLDADTLVRRNFDELFDSPFQFAAVPDVYGAGDPRGFSITINAGVLAFRPSSAVYEDMLQKLEVAEYPLQQAEQAFLNLYFGGTCMRLPYIYNANLAIKDRSPILWRRLTDEMRVVHYTTMKPFIHEARSSNAILTPEEIEDAIYQSERRADGFYQEEVGWWRTAYRKMMSDRGHVMRQCYMS